MFTGSVAVVYLRCVVIAACVAVARVGHAVVGIAIVVVVVVGLLVAVAQIGTEVVLSVVVEVAGSEDVAVAFVVTA